MTANVAGLGLIAVAVKGLLYWLGKLVLSAFHRPPHPQFATGKLASRLESGCTELGVKLRLRWAGLDGRSLVAVLPLVDGPAQADTREANGDQHYGGYEPLFHHALLTTPHYNDERSKENARGI